MPEMRSTPKLPQTLDGGGLVSHPVGARGDPGLCRPLPSPADGAKESRAFVIRASAMLSSLGISSFVIPRGGWAGITNAAYDS